MNYIYDPELDFKVNIITEEIEDAPEQKKLTDYQAPDKMFDPNTYKVEDWVKIGLSEKQSQSILNYLEKGGEIKYKQDLLKLYVIDERLYNLLETKVALPERSSITRIEEPNREIKDTISSKEREEVFTGVVQINSASKDELMKVQGIGKYYAEQIIDLRERYGGLYSLQQLKGLYMMTDGKLDTLSEFLVIDKENVNQINVNSASKEELLNHPLVNLDIANSIVFIRERYGVYNSLDDLLQSPYIDSEKLEEISPYLKVR